MGKIKFKDFSENVEYELNLYIWLNSPIRIISINEYTLNSKIYTRLWYEEL